MSSDSEQSISSDLPKPTLGQFRDELETVLKTDLNIDGNYYAVGEHGYLYNNPELSIEGIGPIDFPLSDENAKKIVQVAAKAPYGHGEQTIVDTQVRDTWQIEPAKVQFGNTHWNGSVDGFGRNICSRLGVSSSTSDIRYEFYKLLLYETGSHFLPHQDSEKTEGMFASMIIILPTVYEGGQVHLQHGSKQDVIDVPPKSDSITILGWYTDVTHEIKPITSGYRLALSYNIIHTSMVSPAPHLTPEDVSMARLKSVLERWNATKLSFYRGQSNVMVYVLDHQYSAANLELGIKTLKGKDASTVACLKMVAEDLGFTILFGKLEYYLAGTGRLQPGLDSGSDDDEQKPSDFYNLWERKLTIDKLFDTEGNGIKMVRDIEIQGGDNFIPKTYFRYEDPDNEDHERYTGNDGNNLYHWYYRTALLLFPENDGYKTLYKAGGMSYALSRLKKVTGPPSDNDKKLVVYMLREPHRWNLDEDAHNQALQTIADCCLAWDDSALFLSTVSAGDHRIVCVGISRLIDGMKKFGFDTLKECFEAIVGTKQSLKERLHLIESLPTHLAEPDQSLVNDWCRDRPAHAFASLASLGPEDVPYLIKFAIKEGTAGLLNVIFSQLRDIEATWDFVSAFLTILLERKPDILRHPNSSEQEFSEITTHCVSLAFRTWHKDVESLMSGTSYDRRWGKKEFMSLSQAEHHIGRVISIVDFSISAGQPAACSEMLEQVTAINEEPADGRLNTLFIPLAHRISALLRSKDLPITLQPFSTFLGAIIALYFARFPALPTQNMANIRNLGCGCPDCLLVDQFIVDPTLEHQRFALPIHRRHHIEIRLTGGEDLVYFIQASEKEANPTGLDIRKRSATVLTHEWQRRSADAKAFLRGIGPAEELSSMLGSKYEELQAILSTIDTATTGGRDIE